MTNDNQSRWFNYLTKIKKEKTPDGFIYRSDKPLPRFPPLKPKFNHTHSSTSTPPHTCPGLTLIPNYKIIFENHKWRLIASFYRKQIVGQHPNGNPVYKTSYRTTSVPCDYCLKCGKKLSEE
jgi:hypothetical protein